MALLQIDSLDVLAHAVIGIAVWIVGCAVAFALIDRHHRKRQIFAV